MEDIRYPIGKFAMPSAVSEHERTAFLKTIKQFPSLLTEVISGLNDSQLDTPYRPDGWRVCQLIHHLADSHTNACMRFRHALTEDTPTVKAYFEALWAELDDAKDADIKPSIMILEGVHSRWSRLMSSMNSSDWDKAFVHPQRNSTMTLAQTLSLYAWHCHHHLAHIENLKKRMGW